MNPSGTPSFDVARERGAVRVTVHGDLDLAASARLGAVLGDLIEGQGNLAVTLDLHDVGTVHPPALGVLEVCARVARRRGGTFEVRGTSRDTLRVLQAAGDDVHAGQHLVEFYDGEAPLADSVCDYLEPALRRGDAVVVVATKRHRYLFQTALVRAGIDVERARADGRYVALDAEATLARFMVGGTPDPSRFETVVGGVVAGAGAGGRAVRIYGEMVAVLWADGKVPAAMALEDLWNELGRSQPFSLLCAYPSTAFDAPETSGSFRAICQQHAPAPGIAVAD